MAKRRVRQVGIGVGVLLASAGGYWGYCSYYQSCPVWLWSANLSWLTAKLGAMAPALTAEQVQQIRAQNIALFNEKKLKYLYHTKVEGQVLAGLDLKQLAPYTEDPAKYDALTAKYGAQIQAGALAPVSIKFVNEHVGYGVFAEAPIKAGDFVGEYTGIIQDKAFVRDTTYSWVYPILVNGRGEKVAISLDSKFEGNEMRYVNHAQDPNTIKVNIPLENVWHECYIAVKDIPVGKQVTVSYGDKYWKSRGKDPELFE